MNNVWILFHESKIHKIFASRESCLTEMREQAILGNFMAYQEMVVENEPNHDRFLQPHPDLDAWLRTAALQGDCRSIHDVGPLAPSKEVVVDSINSLLIAANRI